MYKNFFEGFFEGTDISTGRDQNKKGQAEAVPYLTDIAKKKKEGWTRETTAQYAISKIAKNKKYLSLYAKGRVMFFIAETYPGDTTRGAYYIKMCKLGYPATPEMFGKCLNILLENKQSGAFKARNTYVYTYDLGSE